MKYTNTQKQKQFILYPKSEESTSNKKFLSLLFTGLESPIWFHSWVLNINNEIHSIEMLNVSPQIFFEKTSTSELNLTMNPKYEKCVESEQTAVHQQFIVVWSERDTYISYFCSLTLQYGRAHTSRFQYKYLNVRTHQMCDFCQL